MSGTDVNALAQEGKLPRDPAKRATPVTKQAKDIQDEEGRIHIDSDLMRDAFERLTTVRTDTRLMTTLHHQVDYDTGGFEKEFVWVIGADTSWGKSSYAIGVLDENQRRGFRPLIVSWEDSHRLFGSRILARRAQVSATSLKAHQRGYGRLTADEYDRLATSARGAPHDPIIIDARGKSVEKLAKQIHRVVKQENIDIVMVDYIQAGENDRKQQDRRNQVSYIGRALCDSIKTAGAAGIIFSQITVKDGQKYPDRHSLKEGRDLANMAEVVALGFLADQDKGITGTNGVTLASPGSKVLFVDKVKDGPPKKIHELAWNDTVACFDVVPDPEQKMRDAQAAAFEPLAYPGSWHELPVN